MAARPLLVAADGDGIAIEQGCSDPADAAAKKRELAAVIPADRAAALTWWYYPDPAGR